MVKLYTTFCPKCKILESKLKDKEINYEEISDIDLMLEKGYMEIPILEVDDKVMNFVEANKWINER